MGNPMRFFRTALMRADGGLPMNRSDSGKTATAAAAPHLGGEYLWHDNIPIGVAILSAKNVFLRVNRALCRFLGYSQAELLGKTVRGITYPADWDKTARNVRLLHSGCQPYAYRFEKRFLHRNGKVLWGEVNSCRIDDGSRKPQYRLTQVVDITERKEAEEALRLANERLRTTAGQFRKLAENSPDIIARFDREYHHLYDNPAGLKLLGLPAGLVIGKAIRETGLAEPYRSKWEDRIRRVFRSAKPMDVTDTFPSPAGIQFFESRCVPEFNPKGQVEAVLVISRNITQRKRTEQALRESKERFEAVFRTSPVGIIITRVCDGKIVEANDACLKLIGYSEAETIGHTVLGMGLWANPKDRNRAVALLRKQGRLNEVEIQLRRKSGAIATVLMSTLPLKLGEGTYLLGTLMDISERKRLGESLAKANQELERKVKDRTDRLRKLTAELLMAEHQERRRIAHVLHEDLQQHLCGMKFRASHLKEGSSEPATIGLADRLINEMDQAILLTRTLTTDLHPPVLSQLGVGEAIKWLATDARDKLSLEVSVRASKRFSLPSDEAGIFVFEAVRELLLNVAKHAGVKRAEVRLSSTGKDWVTIQVRDKGAGFDPNQQKPANNHFGLFSIQERVESFGGRFDITSIPSKGTCATLILPRKETHAT